ncbi:Glyoxylase, beta-lactamase superfamily II [Salinihabitans flavidus]|uniref:Glyoxylase, beta-lactamase superfamily II n=1 Tax=Salinihabitans flavidus TaxID=569882 RepID=A0A1H8SJK6_9RHOB|nr:MBL fold metallo-hydrolase [Salinihabitans flavidus]SEO78468.1 Glyoxylase, beta-lactamase superfamily II [Salinihabitans flavidus]
MMTRMIAMLWLVLALPVAAVAEVLEIQPVTEDVWALVGPAVQRDAENLGNNATFGVVVTSEGVVLMDPGGSWNGAAMIDAAIREITERPVTHVINTGGQDHRWLGNGYWKAQGATVIASEAAVADHKARASMQMAALANFLGEEGLDGTEPAFADVTFEERHTLDVGGMRFEIVHPGPAHTPGDSFVWLAARDTVFTGDIVYVERILGVGGQSSISGWPEAFEAMAALDPAHVVPGHGPATTLERATADTYDYLMNLREKIGALIDEGGGIMEAPEVDQSAFDYLAQFESLAGRNAQTAFEQMEWE